MTATLILELPDEAATRRLGAGLARLARPGDVILLFGTLGTGKSTLARAFVRTLTSEDEEVPSPTFTLVQAYEAEPADIWHFDLYRLDRPEDSFELGMDDAFADGISLIEWPERLGSLTPRSRLDVTLSAGEGETARRAILSSHSQWDDRLKDLAP